MNGSDEKEIQDLTETAEEAVQTAEEDVTDIPDTPDTAEDTENEEDGEEKSKPFADAHEWACSLVYAVLLMLGLNLFVFRSITVTGESMCNTLQDDDRIIATQFLYTPDYGDIVVVQANELVNEGTGMYGEAIIKRVIALEGDTIRFDFERGEVYVNGELLEEDYIAQPTHLHLNGWTESGIDYVVPENCVFVMGDNRNKSRDSRDLEAVGFVDKSLIMGKAILRMFPLKEMTLL